LSSDSVKKLQSRAIPRSREIAFIALFGSLSIILTVISNLVLKLAFVPPVNYLLFDLGEIPVIVCFLAIGPRGGLTAAAIEWLALNLLPTSTPVIGPLFKLISVVSTIIGLWIAWKLSGNQKFSLKIVTGGATAAVIRALALTPANALLLIYLFGVSPGPYLLYILELTAIFNVLQIPFDLVPTYLVLQLPQVKLRLRKNGLTWFDTQLPRTIARATAAEN
jgi:riboflavin transporter FmnP